MGKKKIPEIKPSGGRRTRGKFVVPSVEEMMNDRKQFIDTHTRDVVMSADSLTSMVIQLDVLESVIEFRRVQLNLDDQYKCKDIAAIKIEEQFNGATKTVKMMHAELRANIHNYIAQVREIERLKEKFILQYQFTPEQVEQVLRGNFDVGKWAKEYQESQLGELKGSNP